MNSELFDTYIGNVLEKNNWKIVEETDNRIIFVDKANQMNHVDIYYKNGKYNASIPLKTIEYNYTVGFKNVFDCYVYVNERLCDYFGIVTKKESNPDVNIRNHVVYDA
jgi:hypothetical protein